MKAKELREALKQCFEEATSMAEGRALAQGDPEFDEKTQVLFDDLEKAIIETVSGNLKGNARYYEPEEPFLSLLAKALAFKPYVTFEAYEVADNLTDKQILDAKNAIIKGKLSALEPLRKKPYDVRFFMSLSGSAMEYKRLVGNLAYFCFVYAHLAKHYGSRDGAEAFLKAASMAHQGEHRTPAGFTDEQIAEIIDYIETGLESLKLASDYDELAPWDEFCKSQQHYVKGK